MKNRLTSLFLLLYLTLQMAGSYAGAVELMNGAAGVDSDVMISTGTAQTPSEQVDSPQNLRVDKAVMQNCTDCADCADSAHCLFGSCPSLPMQWLTGIRTDFSLSALAWLSEFPQQQVPENLYRPPIFS